MKLPILSVIAAMATLSGAPSYAATVFEVTDNPGGQALPSETVADGGTYSTNLGLLDSVSINVDAQTSSTSGSLFFNLAPLPVKSTVDLILSTFDFGDFGPTTVTLDDGVSIFSGMITAANTELMFSGVIANSPLEVGFSWTNATSGSFNADMSIAPVPVPAAGLLMLGGIGILALVRRRKAAV